MNINYHVHTPLCNHASGTIPDYIHTAISLGLTEICFLDHLTLNPADPGLSMALEEVALYFHAVRDLSYRYRGNIQVKVGLEIDFHPDFVDVFNTVSETFDFDVIGGSVHYLGETDIVSRNGVWAGGKESPESIYYFYYSMLSDLIDQEFLDMICHFDLPKKFGRSPQSSFDHDIDRLLSKIKSKNLVLEVNTSGYGHLAGEAYPSPQILKKCNEMGIPVTLGSDAHYPKDLVSYYKKAETLLTGSGYKHLCTFTRRRQGRILIQTSN